METKVLEIRDAGIFSPVIATRLSADSAREVYLLTRAGYVHEPHWGPYFVLLTPLQDLDRTLYDPNHAGRMYGAVLRHLSNHWGDVSSGDVVDVRVLLHEQAYPVLSEQLTHFPAAMKG